MTKEDVLQRCYGCAFNEDNKCTDLKESIFEIEHCEGFICPKDCSCDNGQGKPLYCEIIPEELAQLI